MALGVGDKAPDFELPTDGGASVTLAGLAGKPVVVYFYPKDDTPGCTKEAIGFSCLAAEFEAAGAVVIGISTDSVKSHDKFVAKHALKLRLGSDAEHKVMEAFGVWVEKSMYGRTYMGPERSTFLIDPTGTIARVWPKVKVDGHAQDVLDAVQAM